MRALQLEATYLCFTETAPLIAAKPFQGTTLQTGKTGNRSFMHIPCGGSHKVKLSAWAIKEGPHASIVLQNVQKINCSEGLSCRRSTPVV